MNPRYDGALSNRGRCHWLIASFEGPKAGKPSGRFVKARADLEKALALSEANWAHRMRLARLLVEAWDFHAAVDVLEGMDPKIQDRIKGFGDALKRARTMRDMPEWRLCAWKSRQCLIAGDREGGSDWGEKALALSAAEKVDESAFAPEFAALYVNRAMLAAESRLEADAATEEGRRCRGEILESVLKGLERAAELGYKDAAKLSRCFRATRPVVFPNA